MKLIFQLIATLFFIGYIPWAPGTFGSLLGVGVWLCVHNVWRYSILLAGVLIIGTIVSSYAEKKIFYKKDPPQVVIDELAGMLISYLFIPFTFSFQGFALGVGGFVLFRTLDIWKPLFIRKVQRVPDGLGIMIDDTIAGTITAIILHTVYSFFLK